MSEPMLCPIDKTPLVMSERQNIEIDYCPTCRGVWLDRGELDKIIERSAASEPAPAAAPTAAPTMAPQPYPVRQDQYGHGQGHGYDPRYGKKRRKSFLEELFD
jgi:Zn-finger nucleic acid-binding protein